jgi:parvulin-like peptidyl-prolyl isomerase
MKRIFVILILCVMAASAYGDIDPTLARVKLTKVEVITLKQFEKRVGELEEQLNRPFSEDMKRQLLDGMINDKILLQAAERAKIAISQSEVDVAVGLYMQQFGATLGLGRALTEAELRNVLGQQGMKWETFVDQLTSKIKVERLVAQEQKSYFDAIGEPSTEEIESYYESNRTKYPIVSPEMVKFKQIRISTQGMPAADVEKAKEKAEDIYREVQTGGTFDKYLEVYLAEGSNRRIGGLVYETWRRDDEQRKVSFGQPFFDVLFKLKVGERSQVVESNFGYHIIEIIEKIPFQVLELDDKVPPQNSVSVREYIANGLRQNKQADVLVKATNDLLAKLRDEADIQIMESNFPT